ncbi:MAG: D-alanyl-D-alanine carboxypeptidase [Filimonas sp.]|nr:D-alanyl-D-alanine carboxypeptidase [Filimonas sp.]
MRKLVLTLTASYALLASCSVQKKIAKRAGEDILNQQPVAGAHIGIGLYDLSANKYLYSYQSDKYFIPASNTKLFTCYAAMKYLGDSLPGVKVLETADNITLFPTGDPTFIHNDFVSHPVFEYIKNTGKPLLWNDKGWREKGWGFGWAWDDYESDYMAERSAFPIHGNVLDISGTKASVKIYPSLPVEINNVASKVPGGFVNDAGRKRDSNVFDLHFDGKANKIISVPFVTNNNREILASVTGKKIEQATAATPSAALLKTIHSQPTDSMLRYMMYRSDNFYAEQSLLMLSNEKLGFISDAAIIDTLLKTDYKDLPQRPKWVDGSGLSRYNLITPQDFITVLKKMKADIDWKRITTILPTGGTGTLSGYYQKIAGRIFAKTGTLSNNVSLSGFLLTKKDHTILFSVMVNNHMGSAPAIRRLVERFLMEIYEKY